MARVYGIVLKNRSGPLCAVLFICTIDSKVLLMQMSSSVSTSSLRAAHRLKFEYAPYLTFVFLLC
jgi:hypothetical protein